MAQSADRATSGDDAAAAFAEMRREISDAFTKLLGLCGALRRDSLPAGRLAALPLSRLMAELQGADAIDQRLAHLAEILERSARMTGAEGAAARRIAALQGKAIAEALLRTADGAAECLERLHGACPAELGRSSAPGTMRDVLAGLRGLATRLGGETDRIGGQAVPPCDRHQAPVDLGWITALYTMDAEREVHARAFR